MAQEFISSQDIDDLMVTALEGGINYWCDEIKVKIPYGSSTNVIASDVISRGGTLRFIYDERSGIAILDKEKLIKGLKKTIEDDDYCSVQDLMDNHDAETADKIIQFALFDEIVFG